MNHFNLLHLSFQIYIQFVYDTNNTYDVMRSCCIEIKFTIFSSNFTLEI